MSAWGKTGEWTFVPGERWVDNGTGEKKHRGHGIVEDGKGFIASLNYGHADIKEIGRCMAASKDMLAAMKRIEPYLDAIVCYASTCDEHEPNDIVRQFRAAIAKATEGAA